MQRNAEVKREQYRKRQEEIDNRLRGKKRHGNSDAVPCGASNINVGYEDCL